MNVVLRPGAEADVVAACRYFDEEGSDLAEQLIDELDRLLLRLAAFPRSAQPVQDHESVRRALLRRFPFAVFYMVSEDQIIVLRVIHTARSPQEWPEL